MSRPTATTLLLVGALFAQEPKTNHLLHEKSPYLQQHVRNPVDWYPWGTEAFEKARKEDKPVFLSIGYSTCHWCHAMRRESFENQAVADLLNASFVAIKVDREERPDVDEVYMNALRQFTGGTGGYPTSLFLTPDAKPFFGGTYYPPEDREGRTGFLSLLRRIATSWKERREELLRKGESVAKMLETAAEEPSSAELDLAPTDRAFRLLAASFDEEHGGFGAAPKFPRPVALDFLLRFARRTGSERARSMVEITLTRMAEGGIYDQVGGGFHRYATDARWLVPHFEKMLYDNALLARSYVHAWQATGDDRFERIARECLDYVLARLQGPDGGFCCAEDADSEGVEGKFFVWTPEEIGAVLGDPDAAVFCLAFGVTEGGNFEVSGRPASVLHVARSAEEVAQALNLPVADVRRILVEGRGKLLDARAKRVPPHRDEKVLTSWNGLAISAMARAGAALDEPRYVDAARRAAAFLLDRCRDDGRLLRRYVAGEARFLGTLEDYAFLGEGLLDLYGATFEERWLDEAVVLTREMVRLFWNERDGGFFHTGSDAERLLVRPRDSFDGSVPSGNSVAVCVLERLARMTGDRGLRKRAQATVRAFLPRLRQSPSASPQMLQGLEDLLVAPQEVVIAARPDDPALAPMLGVVRRAFLPGAVVMLHPGGEAGEKLAAKYPLLEGRAPLDRARAFVGSGTMFLPPIDSPAGLLEALK